MENVTKRLLFEKVDALELGEIFLRHFGTSSGGSDQLATYYPNEESAALIVYYSKNDNIRLIKTSLSYKEVEALKAKIQSILLENNEAVWVDKIFFTQKPLKGAWECNLFTIREAILNVPAEGRQLIGHPAIIQYQIQKTNDWAINRLREERLFKEYILILSMFVPWVLNSDFEDQFGLVLGVRVFSNEADREAFYNRDTIEMDSGYGIDNAERESSDRRNIEGANNIPTLDDEMILLGEDEHEEFRIPASLETWLEKYRNIDSENKKQLLRSAYWTSFARKVYQTSKSASLVACVQSVEALIPRNDELEKQFKLFLDTYSKADNEVKRILYDRRSHITHGSELLIVDEEIRIVTRPSIHRDYRLVWRAMVDCRKAAINWFLHLT